MSAPTSASSLDEIAQWYETHPIPQSYNAGVVVASILVAWIGSYTTLALLGRRTANRGLRNIILLLCAATSMSAVGIWGLHFVSLFMQLKPTDDMSLYVSYSAGFTVLSLLVPLVALALTFLVLGMQDFRLWRVLVCGVCSGLVVSLMHFSAFFDSSYRTSYAPVQTAFSIIIGCVATTVALCLFFVFHNTWRDGWWKRIICAAVLALGVAAMHYTAMQGTSFFVRPGHSSVIANAGQDQAVRLTSAIAAMCLVLCILFGILTWTDVLAARRRKRATRQIVVASAAFTKMGQLLVRNDGSLPVSIIHTEAETKFLLEELDIRSATFQWLYALSWDWSIIDAFIPRILAGTARTDAHKPGSAATARSGSRAARRNDFGLFRGQYVEAVCQLASELHLPVSKIGTLFDKIALTGTLVADDKAKAEKATPTDDEASVATVSPVSTGEQGIMLLLVREVADAGDADSADAYRARGYRFTDTQHVAGVLSSWASMQRSEMETLLDQLKLFGRRGIRPAVQPGGVYASLFGIAPSTARQGSIDQLVYAFARHQPPAYRLPDISSLSPRVTAFISGMASSTVSQVQAACERALLSRQSDLDGDDDLVHFQEALLLALSSMMTTMRVWPSLPALAQLSADIVSVPSSIDGSSDPARLIVFSVVMPAPLSPEQRNDLDLDLPAYHTATTTHLQPATGSPFVFTPYSLFGKSQMMLLSEPGARIFADDVRAELHKRYPTAVEGEKPVDGFTLVNTAQSTGLALAGTTALEAVSIAPFSHREHPPLRPDTGDSDYSKKSHLGTLDVTAYTHQRQLSGGSSYQSQTMPRPGVNRHISIAGSMPSPRIDEDVGVDEDEIVVDSAKREPSPLPADFWKAAPSQPTPLTNAPRFAAHRPRTAPAQGSVHRPLTAESASSSQRRAGRFTTAVLAGRSISGGRPRTADGTEMQVFGRIEPTWHGAALHALATGPQRGQLLGVDL